MSDILTVCAWCPKGERVTILRLPADLGDDLLTFLYTREKGLQAIRVTGDGVECVSRRLQISDGICDACKALYFPPAQPSDSKGAAE